MASKKKDNPTQGEPVADKEPANSVSTGFKSLNPRQQKFVLEYLKDWNATQAAIRAGYSLKTAKDIACQNLSKLNISAAIKEMNDKINGKLEITIETVRQEMAKVAFANVRDLYDANGALIPISALPRDVAASVSSVKVTEDGSVEEVKLWNKLGALDGLAKHLRMYDDKKDPEDKTPPVKVIRVVKAEEMNLGG